MKKLFLVADDYLKLCGWKDLTMIKLCVASLGILIGIVMPKKMRAPVARVSACCFLASYVPLMVRLIKFYKEET